MIPNVLIHDRSSAPRVPARAGFTLLEMSIAVLVFALAMSAVFQSMVATVHLSSNGAAVDQVEFDAARAMNEIRNDLTTSGWEFVDTPNGLTRATTVTTVAGTLGYSGAAAPPITSTIDHVGPTTVSPNGCRYYPFAQVDTAPGGRFPWTRLDPAIGQLPTRTLALPTLPGIGGNLATSDYNLTNATGLTEARWNASFFAHSQNLIFLRTQIGAWNQTPDPGVAANQWSYGSMANATYTGRAPSAGTPPTLNFSYAYSTTNQANGVTVPVALTATALTAADWRTANNQAKLGVLYASGFAYNAGTGVWGETYPGSPYGVVLDAGWFDPNDPNAPIKPLWESMSKLDGSAAANPVGFFGTPAQNLREFMYAVVPSTVPNSLGRLVRAYRVVTNGAIVYPVGKTDPGYRITLPATDNDTFIPPPGGVVMPPSPQVAMVVDKVLAEDVVRAVFDTYRSVDKYAPVTPGLVQSLGVNQVRVRLYFARRQVSNPSVIIYRMAETTVAMRGRNSTSEMTTIQATLGTTPIGVDR